MGAGRTKEAEPATTACSGFRPTDLTFLLHAVVERMTAELDRAAAQMGLKDVRDWLVLAALDDGQPRTQLELSRVVCVDKTTLISVLDRLEQHELVVRLVDPSDRRVRIPQVTASGRRVFAQFAVARDAVEQRVLEGINKADRTLLISLLTHIADRQDAAPSA